MGNVYYAIDEDDWQPDEGQALTFDVLDYEWTKIKRDTREDAAEWYMERYANDEGGYTDDGDGLVILVVDGETLTITRHRVWATLSIDYRSEQIDDRME